MFFRLFRRPGERRDIGLLLFAILLALVPPALIAFTVGATIPLAYYGSLYSLIALPGAYFYMVYRRQLGGLEFRDNRLISLYLYLVLILTVLLLLLPTFISAIANPQTGIAMLFLVALLAALGTVLGFGAFQPKILPVTVSTSLIQTVKLPRLRSPASCSRQFRTR